MSDIKWGDCFLLLIVFVFVRVVMKRYLWVYIRWLAGWVCKKRFLSDILQLWEQDNMRVSNNTRDIIQWHSNSYCIYLVVQTHTQWQPLTHLHGGLVELETSASWDVENVEELSRDDGRDDCSKQNNDDLRSSASFIELRAHALYLDSHRGGAAKVHIK